MFSAGPSTEHQNGDKHAIEKEISDAIFSITRRLHDLKSFESSEEEEGSSSNGGGVITVSGHNNGATMNISSHGGEDHKSFNLGHTSVHIYINNNVQGVNNSILYNSSCTLRDPGVHMDFSRIQSEKLGLVADKEKLGCDGVKGKLGLNDDKGKMGFDGGKGKMGVNDDKGKMGLICDEDVEIRAKKGRSHGGRKRSLSEVLSDHEVPLCERETRPSESGSSVNAQICDGSSERNVEGVEGSGAVEATSMEIVKICDGSSERNVEGVEGSGAVEVTSMEIVKICDGSSERNVEGVEGSGAVEVTSMEIVKICDGSSERNVEGVEGSGVVEVTSMEIVKVENGHDRGGKKPSRLMDFTRKFLCGTSVVE